MDSRSLHFCEETRAATGGEGVDVVLNSLPGPAIHAGLEALRPFGRFVELGVRDIHADTPVELAAFRNNITLSTVNLIQLQREKPELFSAMLNKVIAEIDHGRLPPLPYRTFPLGKATEAFRLMAGARHTGKLVLAVPAKGDTSARTTKDPSAVTPGSAYIVTGGLRGVGLETARWLAGQGASHIVLNGRSAPTEATEQTLDELRNSGTKGTPPLRGCAAWIRSSPPIGIGPLEVN